MQSRQRIAIVGIGGIFPQSATIDQFWANIHGGIDTAREVPPGRWILSNADAFDLRPGSPDRVYSLRGCFIENFAFDPEGLNVDRELIAQLDPMCHLALHAARQAWRDAVTANVDRRRVGVVLGNIALPTDKASALTREIFGRTITEHVLGNSPDPPNPTHPLNRYVAGLPGGLVAQALGLGGGSYALDAACASSLYALKLAADELLAGRADAMLTGGVSRPECLYTQMGFSQLRALSPSGKSPAPFDAAADGLVVGEGSAMFVLKRLEDARRDGDRVYAVLAGIGLSNDIHGRLLAPSSEGQLRAMRGAYDQASWRPCDVDLIECHGAGTPVGDAVEFESLNQLWDGGDWQSGQCVLGSVKSNVGHALTAAGSAGLLKVLLALKNETLPPTANFVAPPPHLPYNDGPFRVLRQSQAWPRRTANSPRRAAISAFGFGGINAHVLLEEAVVQPTSAATQSPVPAIAIVGMDAHFGPWDNLGSFRQRVFAGDSTVPFALKRCWGVDRAEWFERGGRSVPLGYFIVDFTIPAGQFRIPPKELEEMLPQQLLMLKVAAGALCDAKIDGDAQLRTGVFIGIELDPNTTNFHLRWSLVNDARLWNERLGLNLGPEELDRWTQSLRNAVHPPLTANRTMGALGGIVASRIAREFRIGGPSFTVSSEECSGLQALDIAVRRLQQGELDRAIVGAVDLAGDIRTVLLAGTNSFPPGEGAAAVILKRLDDAVRDGDRVYAVIAGHGGTADPMPIGVHADIGDAAAATGLAALVKASLCLHYERLPTQFWLRNRADGPRRAVVESTSEIGNRIQIVLEEHDTSRLASPETTPRLTSRTEALFAVGADDLAEMSQALGKLQNHVRSNSSADLPHLAKTWWLAHPSDPRKRRALAFVAANRNDLLEQIESARQNRSLELTEPTDGPGRVAFVFPGSGNHFPGMGRELSVEFPRVYRRREADTDHLRDHVRPDLFWDRATLDGLDNRTLILGQVALGIAMSDLMQSFGVHPDAAIGYSLGESTALFALGAWTGHDEMHRRMMASPLFDTDLAGPCTAARKAWNLKPEESVDWLAGIVPYAADDVRAALLGKERVYLLAVNSPRESVIGGQRPMVELVIAQLGGAFVPLEGVSTVHCEIARIVETAYRELHLLETGTASVAFRSTKRIPFAERKVTLAAGKSIRFYSGATGKSYTPTRELAAESIVAQALQPIDFPSLIEQAYRDGVRVFIEVGPGASCSRMISQILAGRTHWVRSACVPGQNPYDAILRILAGLIEQRVPVDLRQLYDFADAALSQSAADPTPSRNINIPVGGNPFHLPPTPAAVRPSERIRDEAPAPKQKFTAPVRPAPRRLETSPMLQHLSASQSAKAQAHEAYLRFADNLTRTIANQAGTSLAVVESPPSPPHTEQQNGRESSDVALDRDECLEFAVGKIANVLGPDFAAIDAYPTRVRLPDEPLMLVDRIISIVGEPRSMSSGAVVTEHDIHADAWYLDANRIPTCIAVEAGQADLFLSGYLGIDFETKGLAVYRLLDAVVTFHRGLPGPDAVIRYEIHIDSFFRQGNTYLFRFRFEGTVDGQPLLTMRDGCAGFFTDADLAAGKGIVKTELDRRPRPGVRSVDRTEFVPMEVEAYDERQIDALRSGDLAGCYGPRFANLPIHNPLTIPGGTMRLVDRVTTLDPHGGRFGLGFIRAEADIDPQAWFLTCHFIDDQVMPGTLMYECCLHTLRIFLLRMGWVAEDNGPAFEPVVEIASRLKCRGQVLASTAVATYEVTIKELGYRPEPFAIVDALMFADGKPIVEITDMSLQLTGTNLATFQSLWRHDSQTEMKPAIFDTDRILAFAVGKPSEAFGEPYRIFDGERRIARLPGPPYQFLDRITAIRAKPWIMIAGGIVEAQYDVPPDAWYFAADRQCHMPFAVLLEVALQPCGWLAAYIGSALTSDVDLSFRNLGGTAIQHLPVTPDIGTLTTTVCITKAASSGGMIIQDFEFEVKSRGRTVYKGTTNFGFFSKTSLAQQVGVREAKWIEPAEDEKANGRHFPYPTTTPFPDRQMRMIDNIELYLPDGGPHNLGFILGRRTMNSADWFFKAHFYQDPVCPGSLGLESFLQLLKIVAVERWGGGPESQFDVLSPTPHRWIYRGQVIPANKHVAVQATVTAIDDSTRTIRADGFLSVDGLVIYQMNDFTLALGTAPS